MKRRVLYGVADYEEIVAKNGYFVDKTSYIEKLETVENAVFLRPRRFGKSLWCRIMECYYEIRLKDRFDELFGHTTMGRHPTPLRNSMFVLHLDFSTVDPTGDFESMKKSFDHTCNLKLKVLLARNRSWFQDRVAIDPGENASENLKTVLASLEEYGLPPLYVIIDEYDNFANHLIVSHKDQLYRELTADESFFKTFFKTLKEGRKGGGIANTFVTGVLPITMDELASGFNIARFLTLDSHFENMLGFTQTEVSQLLDEIYHDYEIDPSTRRDVEAIIRNHYNGYHFVASDGEALYNSTMLMYFLSDLCRYRTIPKRLIDLNLKTDLSWIRRLTGSNPQVTESFVDQLTLHNAIRYDEMFLTEKFDMRRFFEESFFPISFFYLGMLTRQDDFTLRLPNLNMKQIFVEYFNELHRIDVSTLYADVMQEFVARPDLGRLFEGYWRLYVSQLPEAIFQKVNENFYRTTFFELCSRYLSRWLTFTVERSYPQGRSDLEFIGKHHEKFAGMRWVLEFKYFSNAELSRMKEGMEGFELRPEDLQQLRGYVEGLQRDYPEARIGRFVIYCFGNQGFRVFEVDGETAPPQKL